jgi:hypothetical protein
VPITNRGIIFSIDALVAFIIVLFMLLAFVVTLNNETNNLTQNIGHFFLEEKTILVADSLIKNYNEENALLGACLFDFEKRRVRSNELSSLNFNNLKKLNLNDFFVKSISYQTKTKSKKYLIESSEGICLVVRRFVLIDGEKGLIFVEGCV